MTYSSVSVEPEQARPSARRTVLVNASAGLVGIALTVMCIGSRWQSFAPGAQVQSGKFFMDWFFGSAAAGPVAGTTLVSEKSHAMCLGKYPQVRSSYQCQQHPINFAGNTGLKKCLVIGDGVTFGRTDGSGYTPPLAKQLRARGICDVYHIGQINPSPAIDNCNSSKDVGCEIENVHDICHGYQCISLFASKKCNKGSCALSEQDPKIVANGGWDMIIFNFGIHDIMKRGWTGSKWEPALSDDQKQDPVKKLDAFTAKEAYGEILKNVTAKMAEHAKKILFVTTTPLPKDFCAPVRLSSHATSRRHPVLSKSS